MEFSKLINPWLLDLKPYSPGKPISEVKRELGLERVVKMASNENPLGPSPAGVLAFKEISDKLNLYPDGACYELKQAISNKLSIGANQIVVGNGSDELLHLLCQALLGPGKEVIFAQPSFVMYEIAAKIVDSGLQVVPLKDFEHDLDEMASRVNENTRLIFVCNPNNPTGAYVNRRALQKMLDQLPDHLIVAIDEAYFEYATAEDYPDGVELLKSDPRVVVLRTFSKIYGLAGLRVGYGLMDSALADILDRIRGPFNVNSAAQAGAAAALGDIEHVEKTKELNRRGLEWLSAELESMGLHAIPSQANFIFFDCKRDSRAVFQALLRRGFIARSGEAFGYPTYLRVTTGLQEHNEEFMAALKEELK